MSHFSRAVLLILGIILAGCGTAPILKPSSFEQGHGWVMVRVVTNTATIDRGNTVNFNQWQRVFVTNEQEKKFELLPNAFGGQTNTQVFTAQLPAGRYKLQSLYAKLIGAIVVPLEPLNESFEISATQATGLGTIIVQPTGGGEFTTLRDYDNGSLDRIYRQVFPALATASNFKSMPPLSGHDIATTSNLSKAGVVVISNSASVSAIGTLFLAGVQKLIDVASTTEIIAAWKNEKDAAKRLSMARDSTYRFVSPVQLKNGTLIAGSSLGQIMVRTPDGKWSRIDTGDLRDITAITAVDESNMLAGGEEGIIFETKDRGVSWTPLPPLPANSVVLNLERASDTMVGLVVEAEDAVLYQKKGDNPWQEVKREKNILKNPTWPAAANAGAVKSGNKYITLTANGVVNELDLTTGTLTSRKPPFSPFGWSPAHTFRRNGAGVAFALESRTSWLTKDMGMTWTERGNSCLRLIDAWITDQDESFNLCVSGSFAVSTTIERKSPQGSWQTQSTTPVLTSGWFVSDDGKLIVIAGTEGILYSSTNGGQQWQLERTPLN